MMRIFIAQHMNKTDLREREKIIAQEIKKRLKFSFGFNFSMFLHPIVGRRNVFESRTRGKKSSLKAFKREKNYF
jgi:hypothetical protein